MKVALINIPYRAAAEFGGGWITVPPQGYGGIQRVIATLQKALLNRGHKVALLGAPGSATQSSQHLVVNAAARDEIRDWIEGGDFDIVHDHTNGTVFSPEWCEGRFLSTHHLTGTPKIIWNAVYLSLAQRKDAGGSESPVVRIPVDVDSYLFCEQKEDYLLFLGRVCPWKGALEAAQFADAVGLPLYLAGPTWEQDYLRLILQRYSATTIVLGEVGGEQRLNLLARARAVLALSQPVMGPWGDIWCEPGATIISEAAASGTPVIATNNGCLGEIAGQVGLVVPAEQNITQKRAKMLLRNLPGPAKVRATADREWGCDKIAAEYERLYKRVLMDGGWGLNRT